MDVGKFPCNIVMITLSLTPPRSHGAESWTVEAVRLARDLSGLLSGQAGCGGLHLTATLGPGSSPQTTGGKLPGASAMTDSCLCSHQRRLTLLQSIV